MSDEDSPGRGPDHFNIYGSPSQASGKLRKPLAATRARLLNRPTDCNRNTAKKSFVLSVNAPVFVPMSYQAPQSVQQESLYEQFNRLKNVRPAHLEESSVAEENADVIKTFKTMLFQLTTRPGNIDELIHRMGDMLKDGVTDEETVKQIINLLYEQGVTETNFRYTGAKVCKYLSKDMKDCPAFTNFRNLFLRRCKKDFDEREKLVSNVSTLPRVCGLTMFIGELFLIVELEDPNGSAAKMGVLRSALLDLMLTLLSHPSNSTVKCVTQTMKLTGSTIKDTTHLQSKNDPDLDEVFARLVELEKYPDIGKTELLLIKSVLSLKECNWGRQESSSSTPSSVPANLGFPSDVPSQFLQNEPVFYNSVGEMISREEAGFFDEEEAAYMQFQNVYDPEIEEAYEEFLKWHK